MTDLSNADESRSLRELVGFDEPALAGAKICGLGVAEPGGGSYLASLRMVARRDGERPVVDGAKTDDTSGSRAGFIATAVRTGGAATKVMNEVISRSLGLDG